MKDSASPVSGPQDSVGQRPASQQKRYTLDPTIRPE